MYISASVLIYVPSPWFRQNVYNLSPPALHAHRCRSLSVTSILHPQLMVLAILFRLRLHILFSSSILLASCILPVQPGFLVAPISISIVILGIVLRLAISGVILQHYLLSSLSHPYLYPFPFISSLIAILVICRLLFDALHPSTRPYHSLSELNL